MYSNNMKLIYLVVVIFLQLQLLTKMHVCTQLFQFDDDRKFENRLVNYLSILERRLRHANGGQDVILNGEDIHLLTMLMKNSKYAREEMPEFWYLRLGR